MDAAAVLTDVELFSKTAVAIKFAGARSCAASEPERSDEMKQAFKYSAVGALSLLATGAFAAAGTGGAMMNQSHATMGATTMHAPAPAMTRPSTMTTTSTRPTSTPVHQGQPNQSCGSLTAPNTPGNAASAPGSAFNPDGKAGMMYAGQQPQNSGNPASVSQYDVACANQPH
jgi:hypothetical protein